MVKFLAPRVGETSLNYTQSSAAWLNRDFQCPGWLTHLQPQSTSTLSPPVFLDSKLLL